MNTRPLDWGPETNPSRITNELDSERVNILEWWEFPRKAWIIILSQSILVLFLSSWLLSEYLNNPFMQQYLANLAPTVVPILSLAFGITAAMTATTLYLRFRKLKQANDRLDTMPRSMQARRTPRKRVPQRPPTTKTSEQQPSGLPTPMFIITESKAPPTVEEKKPESPPSPAPTETAKPPEVKRTQ
jgi:hypothetical protein